MSARQTQSDAASGKAFHAWKPDLPELGVFFLSLCLRYPNGPFLHECV